MRRSPHLDGDALERLERAVQALGETGVMQVRGVDIDQGTLNELQTRMAFLDGFLDTHQVSEEFRPKQQALTTMLENLRQLPAPPKVDLGEDDI